LRIHTLRSRLLLGFAALALPAVMLAAGTSAAHAETIAPGSTGVSIQLLEIKSTQQSDPRASVSIVDRVEPGASLERSIRVMNVSDTTKAVRLYSTGATVAGGTFSASESPNALSGWISAGRDSVTLASAEAIDLIVTITVPADAPSGEQYAAIWAEVQSAPDPASNIVNSSRAGLRVYLQVGGDNAAAADFSIDSLTANRTTDGNPTVHANVTNTSGRAIELRGSLTLADGPGGLSAGPIDLDAATALAPGESGRVNITLDVALPAGPWDATLTLTGAMVTHDRTAQLTFPDVGTSLDAGTDGGFLAALLAFWLAGWVWITLALLGIAALAIGLGIKLRARVPVSNQI
jgi:hypothetical protein